ncbi:uncharacterized protein BDZ99DRAFT_456664 [Mytilinidion resinicola]|uniref:Protein N-terminal and lysine N-methyltransferase EFM7 n=1 Tax=Mytilinidion resinicola TaxID=574789 RepID=A0A6A6Z6X1_9PEZI|nr:uncharacterized protein BDZ99DRAFT_456664 [Mytilinidion resinicola]KAF2816852.1 hypothetical protein BDZ99DRAFT_456664 [Mytilinidion resinicola]
MASDSEDGDLNLFAEPEGFYQPEKSATYAPYTMLSGQELQVRLVGHNPLWGHLLWNGGRTLSKYFEHNIPTIKGKTVLELGAGGGLPSLICAISGASQIVVTDYPDADLIDNLRHNITNCSLLPSTSNIHAEGYLWGADVDKLTAHLAQSSGSKRFDVLILADLLFNHSEHAKLVKSIQDTLEHSPTATAFVVFTPYRPWLLQKDLAFFDLARESGFTVTKIFENIMDKVMFEEDRGDELLRRTVYGYEIKWADAS